VLDDAADTGVDEEEEVEEVEERGVEHALQRRAAVAR
jgi:hypothetical protein